ncbi:MAG: hypothetical protein ACREER_07835 [Alphaproteobacteria bacterium]
MTPIVASICRPRFPARIVLPVALALLGATATPAVADPIVIAGIMFSDEDGGFTIIGGWGAGSLDDPIVVVEEIVEPRPVTLIVRGLSPTWGNRIPTNHPAGFIMRKVVVNRTAYVWNSYDHELQIVRGTPSDIYDGLSFGQGADTGRPFLSDRFGAGTMQDEPRDYLAFRDGEVRPGETVTFQYVITATSAVSEFYIVQDPNRPLAALPTRRPRG